MNKIKISSLWNATIDLNSTIIVNLIKRLSKKDIEFTSIQKCDILLFGPYENQSLLNYVKRKFINKIKKINLSDKLFPNIDYYLLNRKIKPLKIYLSWENFGFPNIGYDFSITSCFGIGNRNHLRFPLWKDLVDWSHLDVLRNDNPYIKRFDSYYKIKDLINPQGENFMMKPKKMCLISSHLNEPRKSIYSLFKKKFQVDGYGPFFNENIKDHCSNPITKRKILENYAFNLCPENSLYPGYYTEKIPEAFISKCLPITWVDKNVNFDFNEKAFINLLNYSTNNYSEIMDLIEEPKFLKTFSDEPLLLKSPNLDNEINFAQKIVDSL